MTRVRGDHKPSLLDLVITKNSQTLFDDVAHKDPLGKSDDCVLRSKYLVSVQMMKAYQNRPPHNSEGLNISSMM